MVEVASKMHSVKPDEMAAVAGDFADAETLVALKDLLHSFDSEKLFTEEGFPDSGAGWDRFLACSLQICLILFLKSRQMCGFVASLLCDILGLILEAVLIATFISEMLMPHKNGFSHFLFYIF